MRQAILITGFSNWGKSTVIYDLFGKKYYKKDKLHYIDALPAIGFTVETHSNDDYVGENWLWQLDNKIKLSPDKGKNLLSAFCPSLEERNHFPTLLSSPTFKPYSKIHLFLMEYKWEHHAKLLIDNIEASCKGLKNVSIVVINTDKDIADANARTQAKSRKIKEELRRIYL